MSDKIFDVYSSLKNKYGKEHELTQRVELIINKLAVESKKTVDSDETLMLSLDEVKSLFRPDDYYFERQEVGPLKIGDDDDK